MSFAKDAMIGGARPCDNLDAHFVGNPPRLCRILRCRSRIGSGRSMASRGFKRRIGAYAFLIGCAWQSAAAASDTLLIHGHIYTGNASAPWATAIAVKDGRIEAVGSDADILEHRGGHARVVDLHGQTVIPGIVDSHLHMLYGAFALHGLNLSTPKYSITPDKPDLLVERFRAYAAEHSKDAVLFGRADFSTVPPTTPRSALLDRAGADRPLVVHNTSEHALWLNSAALKLAGLTDGRVAG